MEKISKNKHTKKLQANAALSGRSMVEMLGVLAIIGVLSVGAISGYSKAMMKYKLNKQTVQLSQLFNVMYIYKEQWRFNIWTNLVPYYIKLNEIPDGMTTDGTYIYDSLNNRIVLSNNGAPDFKVIHAVISLTNDYVVCQNVMNVVKEHHAQLYNVFTGVVTEDDDHVYANQLYGDAYCNNSNCIRDITQEAIYNMCQACTDTKSCSFDIEWRIY